MIDHHPEAILAVTPRARSRGFLVVLALITLVPLLGVPLGVALMNARGGGLFPGAVALALIAGPMHVAATGFFYFDPEFRPVIGESRLSCLWSLAWLPLALLAVGLFGVALIGAWAYLLIFTFHNIWLFYHYQRQNFGLASFISKHIGGGQLPARLNLALNLAALGAIVSLLGTPGFLGLLRTPGLSGTTELLPAGGSPALRTAGTLIYVGALLLMFGVFRSEPRLLKNAWLTGAIVLATAFFLPAIVFESPAMAFLPLATAHGAQYILMMSVVSGRSGRGVLGLVTMCAVGVGMGFAIESMRAWPMILLGTGLVQVHFLVDAKVWRLRERRQRAIMHERFDFLLSA